MSDVITIQNKLEVKSGGVLLVPGCEPVSSLTAIALTRNWNCNASVIPVADALRLVPGSRLVKVMRPVGAVTTGYFFELPPHGPPPPGNACPGQCYPDWYAVLRENSRVLETEEEPEFPTGACVGFSYSGCVVDQDPLHRAPSIG